MDPISNFNAGLARFRSTNELSTFFDPNNINPRDVNLPRELQQTLAAASAFRQQQESNQQRVLDEIARRDSMLVQSTPEAVQANNSRLQSLRIQARAFKGFDETIDEMRTRLIDEFVQQRDQRILDQNAERQAEADQAATPLSNLALRGRGSGVNGRGLGLRGAGSGVTSLLAGL